MSICWYRVETVLCTFVKHSETKKDGQKPLCGRLRLSKIQTRLRRDKSMNYTATDVKKLREETGATFADCKNALTEATSWQEAVKLLEARSDKKAEKMIAAGRETK